MKNKIVLFTAVLLLLSLNLFLTSCGDDDPAPDNKSRNVKFELTGTYTGKVDVTYTLANGGIQSFSDIQLPWTKELVYENDVLGLAFTGSGEISAANVPGQTVNIKIYSNNNVVKTGSATVDNNQVLVFPALSYLFP
jgi:hypothetical protein